jgi:RNA polymerase sigma-70 factor (ECF subfamily)
MRSDRELIELANNGDPDAFEILYRRYKDWVYRLAWRFTNDQTDAQDVVQETFIYLLGKFPGFELTASMVTFLYPVVKHISLNMRGKHYKFVSDDEILGEMAAPASKEAGDSRAELAVVLAGVPDEQREVLLMRFVDDMSLQEIAEALKIPLGTVKSRLHNALQKLRNDHRTKKYFLE